jgi:hypothetical protein
MERLIYVSESNIEESEAEGVVRVKCGTLLSVILSMCRQWAPSQPTVLAVAKNSNLTGVTV